MLVEIIKAFIIGVCASVPLGPIAIFVMQKSLSGGHRAGFMTGLGASLVDTLYAIIAIFALAAVESFIVTHSIWILLIGGLIVGGLGCSMAFKDPFRKIKTEKSLGYSWKDFAQAIAMGLSNPGAIAVIFALFAFFRVKVENHDFTIAPVIMALSAGSATYWFFYSWLFSHLRKNFRLSTLVWINRISGIIVMIVGLALIAEGLMKLLFV